MYDLEGMENVREIDIAMTPFGSPSAPFTVGTLHGVDVAFLARHAPGHTILPEEIPSRANIYAFKMLGVKWIISVSACGSLKEEFEPGHLVVPDGLFDRTSGRDDTFFGKGAVAHVSLADPFCPVLSKVLFEAMSEAVRGTDKKVHMGGALVSINGPRFSTRTESKVFRKWGLELINMTTVPEFALAREAEIGYASAAQPLRQTIVFLTNVFLRCVVNHSMLTVFINLAHPLSNEGCIACLKSRVMMVAFLPVHVCPSCRYAVLNHVTDYDCWRESEKAVTVQEVIATMQGNVTAAKASVSNAIAALASNEELVSPAWVRAA